MQMDNVKHFTSPGKPNASRKRERHDTNRQHDLSAKLNHAGSRATSKPNASFDEQTVKSELRELARITI